VGGSLIYVFPFCEVDQILIIDNNLAFLLQWKKMCCNFSNPFFIAGSLEMIVLWNENAMGGVGIVDGHISQ
jgi:hypothetical protein